MQVRERTRQYLGCTSVGLLNHQQAQERTRQYLGCTIVGLIIQLQARERTRVYLRYTSAIWNLVVMTCTPALVGKEGGWAHEVTCNTGRKSWTCKSMEYFSI
jgi:hypothetical protein